MINSKQTSLRIRSNAQQAKYARRLRRILPATAGLALSLLVIVYVVSMLVTQNGSFTINVKDYDDRSYALALSETASFKTQTSALKAGEVFHIDNITYTNLPDDLNDVDGSHNGENYLAYTFYLKNTGQKECSYRYQLDITRATVGIDGAVRVRIYYTPDYYQSQSEQYHYGGDYIDYAKPKTGGNGQPEEDPGNRTMTNFVSGDIVAQGQKMDFRPGDISKFTVVIWLEGEDPDCTDDILGGQFKVDMNIEVLGEGNA